MIENDYRIGLDIGGSITKMIIWCANEQRETLLRQSHIVQISEFPKKQETDNKQLFYAVLPRTRANLQKIVDFLREFNSKSLRVSLRMTGGGSNQFLEILKKQRSLFQSDCLEIEQMNEMLSLKQGLQYQLENFESDFIQVNKGESYLSLFPLILSNVGSGSSILKITESCEGTRIGGTSIGASSFLGLCLISELDVENPSISTVETEINFFERVSLALEHLKFELERPSFDICEFDLDRFVSESLDLSQNSGVDLLCLINILRENIQMAFYKAENSEMHSILMSGSIFSLLSENKFETYQIFFKLMKVLVMESCRDFKRNMKVTVSTTKGLLGAFGGLTL